MADLFIRALLAAHKVTGDTAANLELHLLPILDFMAWGTSPLGSQPPTEESLWTYICPDPRQGWTNDYLTLVEHLTAAPMDSLYLGAGSGRVVSWLREAGMACAALDIADEAVELMARRGIEADKMDSRAMSYVDSSHDRVILHGDGLLDAMEDPADAIAEAARVAGSRLVVTGYEISADPKVRATGSTPVMWGMEWQGERESGTYYAHSIDRIEGILVALGMRPIARKVWADPLGDGDRPIYGDSYLIEARW